LLTRSLRSPSLPSRSFSRKAALRGEDGVDTVPARFDPALWARVDRGDFTECATLRLDAYRLKRAADGDGDWCARAHTAHTAHTAHAPAPTRPRPRSRANAAWRAALR
jgi:hypothetical protein